MAALETVGVIAVGFGAGAGVLWLGMRMLTFGADQAEGSDEGGGRDRIAKARADRVRE